MWRKLLLILLLAGALTALLLIKPWRTVEISRPRIIDRLPNATVIGQSNLLNLSKDLSKSLYYYKFPLRDVLSPNIILSRSKRYGLDSQKPVYFFINDSLSGKDWGILLSVSDEHKIELGIQRIAKSIEIRDTVMNTKKLSYSPEFNIFIAYEEDWFLIYQGDHCSQILEKISNAKYKEIHPRWRNFLTVADFKYDDLIAEIKSEELKKFGLKSTLIRLNNDSTHFILNTIAEHYDTVPFQLKKGGRGFPKHEFTRQLINLNLDFSYLISHPNHSYNFILDTLAEKIGFPVDDFWENFDGNIAFRRGGIEYIREKYIVSELDDDFNVTEVVKTKRVKISNFSLFVTTNKSPEILFNRVKSKGIVSEDGKKHRFIFSPPFNQHFRDSSMIFYTSQYEPVVNPLLNNQILWTFDYIPVQFYIDSTTTKTVFGRIRFPLKKFIDDYLN